METTDPKTPPAAETRVNRRAFIRTTGVAAAMAGGIEGILAARRAPAFAQGTKLHIVRWVDFIPEADVELKRQMPEAAKALGAEVTLETINANDLQPRITAADPVRRAAPTSSMLPVQLAAPLPERARRRERRRRRRSARPRAASTTSSAPPARSAASGSACRTRSCGNAVAYRKSWLKEIGANEFPKTWDECAQGRSPSSRRRASRTARRSATPSATRRPSPTRCCGPSAAPRPTRRGKKVVLNSKGALESVKFMQALLEGGLRRGRPGLGRHQQQPRVPRRRALAPRSTAPRSTSWPSGRRTRSRTTRASRCGRTSTTRPLPAGPGGPVPALPQPRRTRS